MRSKNIASKIAKAFADHLKRLFVVDDKKAHIETFVRKHKRKPALRRVERSRKELILNFIKENGRRTIETPFDPLFKKRAEAVYANRHSGHYDARFKAALEKLTE